MGPSAMRTEDGWAIYLTTVETDDGRYPQLTPFIDSPEELARYCADHPFVVWPFRNTTYEQWLNIIKDKGLSAHDMCEKCAAKYGVADTDIEE